MGNKRAREQLLVLYGCRCLLTGLQTTRLTYHHLQKKEHKGKSTTKNGAQLWLEIHRWLHSLEHTDIELYDLVNECLDLYKQCMDLNMVDLINQYENECIPEFKKKL